MAKKAGASEEVPKASASAAMGYAPAPEAVKPAGWQPLKIETRPFWSPAKSRRPLVGTLLAHRKLDVEGIEVLCVRAKEETDVVLSNGQIGIAPVGAEVVVAKYYALSAVPELLANPHFLFEVWIGNPRRYDLGTEAGAPAILWSMDVVVNPNGIPRPTK